ncbi:MAG: caspase family protein [Chitinophagaceae bacterium]
MPKGMSLHIGLNKYNLSTYKRDYGKYLSQLPNCHRDALAKQEVAQRFNFKNASFINEEATAENMLTMIDLIAAELEYGDMFFLSFSGHGSRVADRNYDEDDGYDETWCLYDRMVTDDELFEKWKRFRPGVRILVIADSCHSGTSIKNTDDFMNRPGGRFPAEKTGAVLASCLLMSACQDKESAFATPNLKYSLYTSWMLRILKQYDFCESYRELHNRISANMPANSRPNLFTFGPGGEQMIKKRPFKI